LKQVNLGNTRRTKTISSDLNQLSRPLTTESRSSSSTWESSIRNLGNFGRWRSTIKTKSFWAKWWIFL